MRTRAATGSAISQSNEKKLVQQGRSSRMRKLLYQNTYILYIYINGTFQYLRPTRLFLVI